MVRIKSNDKVDSYFSAFVDILFFDLYSPQIKNIGVFMRFVLYGVAVLFFYAPILFAVVTLCLYNPDYIAYLCGFILMHIISKLLFHYTKIIQLRFTDAKKKRRLFIRILLVIEYIVLMWFVYLFYPITCILFPVTMIFIGVENVIGFQFLFNILITHMEQFIFYGGISAYVAFLFIIGYKKMMSGLMPAYLRMYIILAAISRVIDMGIKRLTIDHLLDNLETFSFAISQIFTLSNQALNIVSTFVMFAYATYSLFTTCGIDTTAKKNKADILNGDTQ